MDLVSLLVVWALALVVFFVGCVLGASRAARVAVAGYASERERLVEEAKQLGLHAKEREIALQESERKTETNLRMLLEMQRQRDEWQKLYMDQGAAHGNAQNLMMSAIEHLSRTLQANGIKHTIPPILQRVREEFVEIHEAPIAKLRESQAAVEPATDKP